MEDRAPGAGRQPLPRVLIFVAVLGASFAACQTEAPEEAVARRAPTPTSLDVLRADVRATDANTVRRGLSSLSSDAEMALEHNAERPAYRLLLAEVAIELWLYTEGAELMARAADDPELARRWLEEASAWRELVQLAATSLRATFVDEDTPRTLEHQLVERLRPMMRPLLRDPAHQARARAVLRLLDWMAAAASGADTPADVLLRRADALDDDALPLGLHRHLALALHAYDALLSGAGGRLADRGIGLALATGQTCADGLESLLTADRPDEVIDLMRRRCGYLCTEPLALGGDQPVALPTLDPATLATCASPHVAGAEPGRDLALDSTLATGALAELARLRDALGAQPTGTNFDEIVAPIIEGFGAAVGEVVIPGQLPFPSATLGPFELPEQRRALHPIEPTPAVAVVADGALSITAWPRYGAHDAESLAESHVPDELAWPGVPLGTLGAVDDGALAAALETIAALPWPVADTAGAPVTIAIAARATMGELRLALRALEQAGVTRVVIATWPHGDDGLIARPSPTGLLVRIDEPERRSPTLQLADNDAALVDTLGRRAEIPIFAVYKFLPDIYARVVRYVGVNPAITELVVEPDDDLDIATVAGLVAALQWRRQGDVMSSTEALLSAPLVESSRTAAVSLIEELHLR